MIFYLVNVDYTRQIGEDNPSKVKETYLVNAPTPSDAERVVLDWIKPFMFGDYTTTKIQKVQFFKALEDKINGGDWYKAKVEIITIDGDKETRKAVNILIQDAKNIESALSVLSTHLLSFDFEIVSISRTPIIDILNMEDEV